MTWFEQLEIHLCDLYLNKSSYAVDAFKPAFCTFFDEEHQTFILKMFHNLNQLRLQLERENLHEVNAKTCIKVLQTRFKEYFCLKRGKFVESSESIWIKLENNNALSKSVNETQLQQHESLVTKSIKLEANLNTDVKALDVGGGEIDQDAEQYQVKSPLLNAELFKRKEMIEKQTYNELSHSSGLVQNLISPTPYVPPSKKDYEILFQPLFDEYFSPPSRDVSPDLIAIAALRVVDLAGLPSSTTIDQDVPSASTSLTNQEIQSQVTHQGVEEQIHGRQNA
nr:hypothetical protein [Tanacetum cinerariifolium]